ncbi:hypothetical protein BDFB_009780 [Asbolus verrucosus]|uniref:Chitin deacetylase n=1 Tax=Asbolus verrucosus TaxID=1661398 RepID=A0A482VKV8_ASBVE|nr:hypothetical protein BDFB_009780 [Asbolus verrucosus]
MESQVCTADKCRIEHNCRCSSKVNPLDGTNEPAPQLIAFTVSESVVGTVYDKYLEPLFFNRKNFDGGPVGVSFYVNHENTDYTLVQDLYLRGFEIGVHSITKNPLQSYWRNASYSDLVDEFWGQRQLLSHFANIPIEDIIGVRTPQPQVEGDVSIDAYVASGLTYDNSLPTSSSETLLPYTLDYESNQACLATAECPKNSHPHFWITPIADIKGDNDVECNSLVACLVRGGAEETASWLVGQIDRVYHGNRAPIVLRLDSYWFSFIANSFDGFSLFLDEMSKRDDVFLVSVGDVLDWIKHPVSAKNYKSPIHERNAECNPVNCSYSLPEETEIYMKTCVPCPEIYPWKGNPLGERTN